jgi:hypothetical protein
LHCHDIDSSYRHIYLFRVYLKTLSIARIYCDVCCLVMDFETRYTHATVELRMLLLVARQQSARQAASEVTIK